METLHVPDDARGERLDRFLARLREQESRSHIQKAIASGKILLDGKIVAPHRFLKGGENIAFVQFNAEAPYTPPTLKDVRVLFADEHVAVLEKPIGILVHPAEGSNEHTLLDWLAEYIPETTRVGDPLRPGIVHRLDRDVSGVLVVAKSSEGYSELLNAFRERHVQKTYIAIVAGNIERDEGVITFPIRRAKHTGRMAAIPVDFKWTRNANENMHARHAETRFTVRERLMHATIVEVQLITGRSHQIRVHFFASGHPVLGDPLYPAKEQPRAPLERLYLHAHSIAFPLFGTLQGPFTSKLPEAFTVLRTQLTRAQ